MNTLLDADLPGSDLVRQGLDDLAKGRVSDCALLLQVTGPRLRAIGLVIPRLDVPLPYEHRLYEYLEQTAGDDAYSRYNSLLRRMASYAAAAEHLITRSEGKG